MELESLATQVLLWHQANYTEENQRAAGLLISPELAEKFKALGITVKRGCIKHPGGAAVTIRVLLFTDRHTINLNWYKNGGPPEFTINGQPYVPIPVTTDEVGVLADARATHLISDRPV